MSYIRHLLTEAQQGDQSAAEEVFDFIEHVLDQPALTVAVAFGLRDEELSGVGERHVRDGLIRGLQNFLGEGLSLREQAEAIRERWRDYVPEPEDQVTQGERRLLWELKQRDEVSERQIRRILGGK
jgi:hypothetical protein